MKLCKINDCYVKHRAKGFCNKHYKAQYFQLNKEKIYKNPKRIIFRKRYYTNNKNKEQKQHKIWRLKNKNYRKQYMRNWAISNIKARRSYSRKYLSERRKKDPLFKLKNNITCRLRKFIKGSGKLEYLKCSVEFLRSYLESKFKSGMTWENHGLFGWHIDHIIPLSSANTKKELIKLCHYTNLQPLWAIDNLKKGNTYESTDGSIK